MIQALMIINECIYQTFKLDQGCLLYRYLVGCNNVKISPHNNAATIVLGAVFIVIKLNLMGQKCLLNDEQSKQNRIIFSLHRLCVALSVSIIMFYSLLQYSSDM